MSNKHDHREMSQSGSPEAGDDDDHHDDSGDERRGGRPGRKKNPNTAAARRDQNRIAQREFRLRKQQKIRDLEARVELLSGNKDEMYGQLRLMLRALMEENSQLRGLLREMGKWIGDGSGGPLTAHLTSVGWQMNQFQAFLNHTETDTAFEIFSTLKKQKQQNGTPATVNGSSESPAPTADDVGEGSNRKRRRIDDSLASAPNGLLGNPSQYVSPDGLTGTSDAAFASFLADPQGTQSSSLLGLATAAESSVPMGIPEQMNAYQPFNMPPIGSFCPPGFSGTSTTRQSSVNKPPAETGPLFGDETGTVDDGGVLRKNEAGRLFKYHLDNFRRNPSYCLPRILQPTLVQRTVPHEQIIDSMPYADLRDRMILMKDRFSLPEALHDMFTNATIHGDDVLQPSNWELHKPWLERYPFLVSDSVLSIANKWRRERGEPEITLAELSKDS